MGRVSARSSPIYQTAKTIASSASPPHDCPIGFGHLDHPMNYAIQNSLSHSEHQEAPTDDHLLSVPSPITLDETREVLKSFMVEIPRSLQARVDKSDMVQEVLLKISQNDYGLDEMNPPQRRLFLRKMLATRVTDFIRAHFSFKRDPRREENLEMEVSARGATPSADLIQEERQRTLHAAIATLPAEYQHVLRLRHGEGLGFAEIGARTGRSPDAARVLWGRAVKQLKRIFEQRYG